MERNVVVIMHRWGNRFMDYSAVIDHDANMVVYLVNRDGSKGIESYRDKATHAVELQKLDDFEALLPHVEKAAAWYGKIDRIVAMSEFDLIAAARLRSRFGVAGTQEHQVMLYRDKVEMKKRLQQEGVRVPEFVDCASAEEVLSFAALHRYPLILKPKCGASSKGVYRIGHKEELRALLPSIIFADYECEEFVNGPIYHVDGLVHGGELAFVKVSRYVNTCLEYNSGKPLGSIVEDNPVVSGMMTEVTRRTLAALELANSAFHLEIIFKDEKEPVFLEIGARIGGGAVPFLLLQLYGVHMAEEWLRIELGTFAGLPEPAVAVGGFLMIPEPKEVPAEVVSVTRLMGNIPGMFDEHVPVPGEIFDGTGEYHHISGRYLYKGASSREVEEAIRRTIEQFRMETRPAAKENTSLILS